MKITIIGTGFVGVVSAAVYASFGHTVVGLDIDEKKVQALRNGKVPFYEPGLEELLLEQQKDGNLSFTTDYGEAVGGSDIVIIAVGTPSTDEGKANLSYLYAATESLASHLKEGVIVVVKSTVPPGTLDAVDDILKTHATARYDLASVPEFLREGSAVSDTLNPDRVVLGATNEKVFEVLEDLHSPLKAPIVKVTPESAQMGKYAANAYLATRITFINQIADLCEHNGADVQEVISVIGLDKRVGGHYWYPGFGYGGSCFPKDVKELAYYSRLVGEDQNLFNKVNELNNQRINRLLTAYGKKIGGWEGKQVAVLGLSFKPNTDDMREAPSTKVVPWVVEKGAEVHGFDPKALKSAEYFLQDTQIELHETIEAAVAGADVVIALIEWSEIVAFDYASTKEDKKQYFIDARNQFNPEKISKAGYEYLGVGRK
ncbi:MAG: UDP-glucose/GDP-mannose dehydrogenase family protein [Pseudomonadales bacterium]|nr:UDP-glucose/GDP-mannose dehydrogenase family protein [Candidatus Woesebacteria bacterium]MCB9800868.1 UDP-glucose/GDP-mannose dehydrogenase family protein [Pseudomonadales bacterium]